MKKIKIILILLFVTFFIYGCGFKPIYSTNNLDLKFSEINFKSNKLNNQIAKSLKSFSNPNGVRNFDVNLDAIKEKKILSKNSKGDTETFEFKIVLNLTVEIKGNLHNKKFIKKIKYNNNDNKFELKQYEIEVEKQIITDLIEEILIFFQKFK